MKTKSTLLLALLLMSLFSLHAQLAKQNSDFYEENYMDMEFKKPIISKDILINTKLDFHSADILFVKHDASGNNDGTSWADAFTSLHMAIKSADINDQLWVATGTYKPEIIRMPADSNFFLIRKRLSLFGGFNGTETALDQRDWVANPTILSADINGDDTDDDFNNNKSDNTQHVMIISTGGSGSMIDGFHVKYGMSRLTGVAEPYDHRRGAGIYCNISYAVIRNCLISQNYASFGSGIAMRWAGQPVLIENCQLKNNFGINAAGMLIVNSNAIIDHCIFENNICNNSSGGGLLVNYNEDQKENTLTIIHSQFLANKASSGGGIFISNFNHGSNITIDSCVFSANHATGSSPADGGAILFLNRNPRNDTKVQTLSATITNSKFDFNLSNSNGAAIAGIQLTDSLNITIDNCQFSKNQTLNDNAYTGGGAIANLVRSSNGSLTYNISNCLFQKNESRGVSGALWTTSSKRSNGPNGIVKNCLFIENKAKYCCGGIGAALDNSTIDGCIFDGNITQGLHPDLKGGGGMGLILNQDIKIINSIFKNNYSNIEGSALRIDNSNYVKLENVLFNNNSGLSDVFTDSDVDFINNTFINGDTAIHLLSSANVSFQNTILYNSRNLVIEDSAMLISKGGNISSDKSMIPHFVGASSYSDYNEMNPELDANFIPIDGSPCVDAGNPTGILLTTDLGGMNRIQGNGIDIGAYESPFMTASKDAIWDSNKLRVYPNPIKNTLMININDKKLKNIDIQIYNLQGQTILSQTSISAHNSGNYKLDVRTLKKGNYFIIVSIHGTKYVQKIIKL